MADQSTTTRLTLAQAIVRWMANQFIVIDGQEQRLFGGGFGIFGHGNVTCLGEALYQYRDALPLYRGQNEQSMGFAAAAYAKYHLRQRLMFCTASAGPGTTNLLTSAALAHANRLPMLLSACLIGLLPASGPHLVFVTLYAGSAIPLSILMASCIVQDGHGMIPTLAHSRRAFLLVKGIKFFMGLAVGLLGHMMGW